MSYDDGIHHTDCDSIYPFPECLFYLSSIHDGSGEEHACHDSDGELDEHGDWESGVTFIYFGIDNFIKLVKHHDDTEAVKKDGGEEDEVYDGYV